MSASQLDSGTDFCFDVNLFSYQQDEFYMSLDQLEVAGSAEVDPKAGSRVSLACIPCRTRHIKCDARTPSCSKCRSDSRTCSYTKSRRGGQRSKVQRKRSALDPHPPEGLDFHDSLQCRPTNITVPALFSNGSTPETSQTSSSLSSFHDYDYSTTHFLDSYYTYFHDAHPITLPRGYLLSRLQSDPLPLEQVEHVMEYIGSLYIPHIPSEYLRHTVNTELSAGNLPMTGFSVQALILFALATHCCNNFEESRVLLDRAITMALEIKMQSRSFAQENGEGNAVLEESWRRTWWLLFITDGTFAGIMRETSFRLSNIPTDVDLPCEEREYAEGNIPAPKSLLEYETREFSDAEIAFSSFTYLIDGARIISAVLPTISQPGEYSDNAATAANAKLVGWLVHLPECKKQIINDSERIDEVNFQAHMLINLLVLYLHRPRSRLAYSDAEGSSKCTVTPPPEQMTRMRQKAYALHTSKTLSSLEMLLGMMALPTPILNHTPLITCGVGMAIMGQMAACNLDFGSDKAAEGRERIRLGIGALKEFAEVWPLGRRTNLEIKAICRQLLNIPNANGVGTPMETVLGHEDEFRTLTATLI